MPNTEEKKKQLRQFFELYKQNKHQAVDEFQKTFSAEKDEEFQSMAPFATKEDKRFFLVLRFLAIICCTEEDPQKYHKMFLKYLARHATLDCPLYSDSAPLDLETDDDTTDFHFWPSFEGYCAEIQAFSPQNFVDYLQGFSSNWQRDSEFILSLKESLRSKKDAIGQEMTILKKTSTPGLKDKFQALANALNRVVSFDEVQRKKAQNPAPTKKYSSQSFTPVLRTNLETKEEIKHPVEAPKIPAPTRVPRKPNQDLGAALSKVAPKPPTSTISNSNTTIKPVVPKEGVKISLSVFNSTFHVKEPMPSRSQPPIQGIHPEGSAPMVPLKSVRKEASSSSLTSTTTAPPAQQAKVAESNTKGLITTSSHSSFTRITQSLTIDAPPSNANANANTKAKSVTSSVSTITGAIASAEQGTVLNDKVSRDFKTFISEFKQPRGLSHALDEELSGGISKLVLKLAGMHWFEKTLGLDDQIVQLSIFKSQHFLASIGDQVESREPEVIKQRRVFFLALLDLNFCLQRELGLLKPVLVDFNLPFFKHIQSLNAATCIEQIKTLLISNTDKRRGQYLTNLDQLLIPIYMDTYSQHYLTPQNALTNYQAIIKPF